MLWWKLVQPLTVLFTHKAHFCLVLLTWVWLQWNEHLSTHTKTVDISVWTKVTNVPANITTTIVQNKYFHSVLQDCSQKATCHLHSSVRTPRCPFFFNVGENSPSIPGNLFTISSHARRADSGLWDCDCFSISEDYLRVCTQYRPGHEEEPTRGSGKQVSCVEGTGTFCFSGISGIIVYRSRTQIVTSVQYHAI